METVNIVICGLGGQGILFMTKILAQTALKKGFNIMGAETHGMAQRGGSVVSHLRLGDVNGSMVRPGSAQILFALEQNECYRNLPLLQKGGRIFVSTDSDPFPRPEVAPFLEKRGILCHATPAGAMALELGVPMSSNLAMLGYYSAFKVGPVTHEELANTIESASPERFREKNLQVFDAGFQGGLAESGP